MRPGPCPAANGVFTAPGSFSPNGNGLLAGLKVVKRNWLVCRPYRRTRCSKALRPSVFFPMPGRIIFAFTSPLCPAGPVSSNGARIKATMNGNAAIPSIWSNTSRYAFGMNASWCKKLALKCLGLRAMPRRFQPMPKASARTARRKRNAQAARRAAWRLAALAKALEIDATLMMDTAADDLRLLLMWIDRFSGIGARTGMVEGV